MSAHAKAVRAGWWDYLGLSRQRRYQLRHHALGLCMECSRPLFSGWHCLKHLRAARVWKRDKYGHRPWQAGKPGRPPTERRV